ncbi:hypothetical protein SASPL_156251 [Salvia splendens]|uniref:Uncharacterized protein n=1 Tax=Salvia splendens TaxID=180675 RepID=A0A8X8VX03_SALSN|nr:hypothetical protein SASPL_156251 [Salvia splendens]
MKLMTKLQTQSFSSTKPKVKTNFNATQNRQNPEKQDLRRRFRRVLAAAVEEQPEHAVGAAPQPPPLPQPFSGGEAAGHREGAEGAHGDGKNMPESSYELSLKDLVEHHRIEAHAPPPEESPARVRRQESKRSMSRSGSLKVESRGVFLNMVLPFSLPAKKRSGVDRSFSSGRVLPAKGGGGGEGDWWRKKVSRSRANYVAELWNADYGLPVPSWELAMGSVRRHGFLGRGVRLGVGLWGLCEDMGFLAGELGYGVCAKTWVSWPGVGASYLTIRAIIAASYVACLQHFIANLLR